MMSPAISLTKRGGLSLILLCLCMSISGPVQSQDLVDPQSTVPGSTTSSTIPTGAAQDPSSTATSATPGRTTDTKPTVDSSTTITQPGLTAPVTPGATTAPVAPGATTATTPTISVGPTSTGLNSTTTSPVTAGPGALAPILQDGNGKKLVFPITDVNGRVVFQNASDIQMSGKHGNSTLPILRETRITKRKEDRFIP
ncbi:hypothetical protein PTTG_03214 [Puccinia triticina 1-1 BBBD Race 1]|uniref:Uncharacterized protein n=1 Tax=Puccinia triticina (isolate 1-1 / race 1 (BBBD)) TaxID=630390 RepID=A0A180GT65_PUCT1|nr:hypothetical protein PTTG_03214 [Puccinia triticina 1-1 BBBD Race 1]